MRARVHSESQFSQPGDVPCVDGIVAERAELEVRLQHLRKEQKIQKCEITSHGGMRLWPQHWETGAGGPELQGQPQYTANSMTIPKILFQKEMR